MELQINERGNARLCPITAFEVRIASNDMVVLVIQYVESIEQFDSGELKQLQTVLPTAQAYELAATLRRAAGLFLQSGADVSVQ